MKRLKGIADFHGVNSRRILYHVGFWVVYFGLLLFNDLFFSSSFLKSYSIVWVQKAVMSILLLMIIKIIAVYGTLYIIIPNWFKEIRRSKIILLSIGFMLFVLLLYRLMVELVIWKYVYNDEPIYRAMGTDIARILYSFLDIIQVTAIAATIKLVRLRMETVRLEKIREREQLRAELQQLKAQINPHFLFNSLNVIYAQALENSSATADTVMKLSEILRYTLYESEKKLTPLSSELDTLEAYINLQQTRFGKRVVIEKEISFASSSISVAPLLLLPLVENAFKHGSEKSRQINHIIIRLHQHKNDLHFSISNNCGEATDENRQHEGIGLSNLRRQLQLLYPDHELKTYREGNRFFAELRINTASYAGMELPDR